MSGESNGQISLFKNTVILFFISQADLFLSIFFLLINCRWNVFHGARILDVETSAKAVSKATSPGQMLAGVGYSMGAIIISNYVARSGANCYLDAVMAISGGLDGREMLNFKRSMRLWQPMLAEILRDELIVQKFENRFRHRLTKDEHLRLMRSSSVTEIDIYAMVSYNGFDDLEHYYTEMSAMGDTAAFQANPLDDNIGRIANVSIPFCVLHGTFRLFVCF